MNKILSLFGWIFLLLGVTLIGIGSLAYWRTSQLQAKGESATMRKQMSGTTSKVPLSLTPLLFMG